MQTFKATRRIFTADSNVPHSSKRIFPLLCPVREHDWIEQWRAEIVYAESGAAELDCVFTTDSPDKEGWEELLIGAGFGESDMQRWHHEFETADPKGHLAFLRALKLGDNEITRIRQWAASPLEWSGEQNE